MKARIQRLTSLGSSFVTVTWGAGGSTADKSLDLAQFAQEQGNTTCLHLTCTNMDKTILDSALSRAKKIGIRNILALRGDPPRGEEYEETNADSEFQYAVDLVRYIRKEHGDYFCIGVAGYPEGYASGAASGADQDPKKDLPFLLEKVEAGADFIVTQLFYNVEKFLEYEQLLRNHESPLLQNIPLLPGLMPINTFQSFIRASKLSHASIPSDLLQKFSILPQNDDESVKNLGVEVISSIIQDIHKGTQGRINAFHFYTLNLEKSVAQVLEKCPIFKVSQFVAAEKSNAELSHNRIIVPDVKDAGKSGFLAVNEAAAGSTKNSQNVKDILAISTGEGALGRAANWDDYTNGRFGDSRSPAYGEIDGYGPRLHVDPERALKIWGYPVDHKDITSLFQKHIVGQLDKIPWGDQPISAETMLIQEELFLLNGLGMWTIASQPACNAAKSEDKIFGWGPKRGRVFQKPFVEFFASTAQFEQIKTKLCGDKDSVFSYYASNAAGALESNLPEDSANAVTWGVFPNREILQSTIIEEESFAAWCEEAFSIWKEWQRLYKPGTASYKLLEDIYQDYYLVTVLSHDYIGEDSLWKALLALN